MKLKLSDIFPAEPEFHLSSRNKTYTLRIPNMQDRAKFREILGSDSEIQKVFSGRDWNKIAKLAYILLKEKADFPAEVIEEIDDDGQKQKYLLTGPAVLMRAVKSLAEGDAMIMSMVTAIRNGDPLIDDLLKASFDSEQKKKAMSLHKKPIGRKSSTRSRTSTATRKKNSAS